MKSLEQLQAQAREEFGKILSDARHEFGFGPYKEDATYKFLDSQVASSFAAGKEEGLGYFKERTLDAAKESNHEQALTVAFAAGEKAGREAVAEYLEHKNNCIRSFFVEGRPMTDGGYEQRFDNTWYEAKPVDKTPKCDCGLEAALKADTSD